MNNIVDRRWFQIMRVINLKYVLNEFNHEVVSLGETLNLDITRLRNINLSSKALTH